MESKIINIKEIGDVLFIKNSKSKYVGISVRHNNDVRVSVPRWVSYSKAQEVVGRKIDWIKQKLKKMESIEKTVFDLGTRFQTKHHRLVITPSDVDTPLIRIKDGFIIVKYPQTKDVKDKDIQDAVKEGIDEALRIEAKDYIPHRVRGLAGRFDLRYRDISVKNIKTRWGSCSHNNNLNFNIHIMRLPEHLIDYIILHELAHTVEKNHSSRFWLLLDKFIGDSKRLNKELKNFKIQIY